MQTLVRAILLVVGLVNAAPLVGVASAEALAGLYGIQHLDGDLLILMRHRALLFGLLGGLIAVSAFKRHIQPLAILAGLVSMLGFVAIAVLEGEYGAKIAKVVWIDVIASAALVGAAWGRWRFRDEA